tara:strand:- start:2361 stop:2924 length:564 start_codon:yes stop_codon:yes gene_type:complete
MARPIYQYKPVDSKDQAIGILLPLNRSAKGKAVNSEYSASATTGKGVFESSYSTQEAVITNLKNLILTQKGERYMQPNFGTNVKKVLFDNNTEDIREALQETMDEDIKLWLPYVKLSNIDISSSDDMHSLNIKLSFLIDSVGANVVINILANENSFQITEVVEDTSLQQVGTFGSDTAFSAGLGGAY